jgi:hypothetical protein
MPLRYLAGVGGLVNLILLYVATRHHWGKNEFLLPTLLWIPFAFGLACFLASMLLLIRVVPDGNFVEERLFLFFLLQVSHCAEVS